MISYARGFKGESLVKTKEKTFKGVIPVTGSNSSDCKEALVKATTHGEILTITGDVHFTSDDMFKAAELPARKAKIQELEKSKKISVSTHQNQAQIWKLCLTGKQ